MMLITDLYNLFDALLLLEEVQATRKQVIRVDACLEAQCDALLVDNRLLALLLVKTASKDFLELLLLVVVHLGRLRIWFDVHFRWLLRLSFDKNLSMYT